ncbi:MAG: FkbM family methyltransferase [Rhodospirillales bacterium]|nr:FkbM family methyltransferase [Rhodospirillales bacterium]
MARWAWRYGRWQFIKRVLKKDPRLVLPTGKSIVLPRTSGSAAEVFVTKADIDWGSEVRFSSAAGPNDDFLDIGSHIGYYALYLSPLVGRVFAFEPDPRNLAALTANAARGGNITVVGKAVTDTVGAQRFDVSNNSAVSHLTSSDAAAAVDVQTITIDAFVKALPDANIRLIKIDIEGHDLNAVKGGLETIRAHQPLILSEFSTEGLDINTPGELTRLCDDLRYRIFAYTRRSDRQTPHLRELAEADIGRIWAKMLFLAPQRLWPAFENETDGRSGRDDRC